MQHGAEPLRIEAKAAEADGEAGMCKGKGGQRVVRAVEKLCEALVDRGVIAGGVVDGSCRVDDAELVGIAGAAAVEQEQPCTLEVGHGGDSFKEGALFGQGLVQGCLYVFRCSQWGA